jgi:nucleoid DNA-binding protein
MRKRDIVLKISQETSVKQVIVRDVVQKTFDIILAALKSGDRIELRNFGVFYVKKRKKRLGRNPKTGQVVPVPERYVAAFKPGMEMKVDLK